MGIFNKEFNNYAKVALENLLTKKPPHRHAAELNLIMRNYKEAFLASPSLACAAAKRATGTLGPEQDT